MASSPLYSFLLELFIVCFFVAPTLATSRGAIDQGMRSPTGFRVELKHVDSGTNFTKFERIQRAVERGNHRLHKLSAISKAVVESGVEAPVRVGQGEFLMTLAIGTPASSFSAIMDTGSDLIWTQCEPCNRCFDQPTPIFHPNKSSSFSPLSCSTNLCQQLPLSTCDDGCQYVYQYGDDSSTAGVLASETFTFGSVSVLKIGFGCGSDNDGTGFSQGAGVVGLGRGPLSLVSQLDEPKFSYCLISIHEDGSKTSPLLLGSVASNLTSLKHHGAIKSTPLLHNQLQPSFYYLKLEGISVGGTRLPINESTFELREDGSGGLIIDSGTTITYIEESAYDVVRKEFVSQMNLTVNDNSSAGLDLCFDLPSDAQVSGELTVPELIFHFDEADLSLPGDNFMIGDDEEGLVCLAMGSSNGISILGNTQQQNFLVLHDLEKETVSFIPTQCSDL
ncbi:hypothetical protein Nepgr_012224 [Nepenthes gracilis]|uniref:Peptidase A1 domain-containing protein n=1 Tax=Nepenthes gracilis TaxID=150966 RepID=A0AAD3SFK0_NEPGR|nr:hypothetical protein Nepgr_012224 [Nepenthes gracilis]